jgi:hypothetical protein
MGYCSCCGWPVPGMPSAKYPGRVTLDFHLHPRPELGRCIGSRSAADTWAGRMRQCLDRATWFSERARNADDDTTAE